MGSDTMAPGSTQCSSLSVPIHMHMIYKMVYKYLLKVCLEGAKMVECGRYEGARIKNTAFRF
jgi:hypothetical protein